MVGIYKITNLVNGKTYVGQSIDIHKRWVNHRSDAFDKKDHCYDYPLYRAIRKYGLENFLFEVIEECGRSELNEREKYYIIKFNTRIPNGYNQDCGGNNAPHYKKLSYDSVTSIIERLKTSNDNSDVIGKEFGISGRTVRSINSGEACYRDGETYPIRGALSTHPNRVVSDDRDRQQIETHEGKVFYKCEKCGALIVTRSARLCVSCGHEAQRKSDRPKPLELAKMVKENGFSKTGKRLGVSGNTIKKWCKSYNIPYMLNDLIAWYNQQVGIVDLPKPTKIKTIQNKPVQQIDPVTNKVIAIFESANEAARKLGKKKGSHISEACNGIHQTAHGYKWQYVA